MRKKLLISILLLVVCFWNFNVKADDEVIGNPLPTEPVMVTDASGSGDASGEGITETIDDDEGEPVVTEGDGEPAAIVGEGEPTAPTTVVGESEPGLVGGSSSASEPATEGATLSGSETPAPTTGEVATVNTPSETPVTAPVLAAAPTRAVASYQAQSKQANSIVDILKTVLASSGSVNVKSVGTITYANSGNTNNSLLTISNSGLSSTVTPTQLFNTAVGITFTATVEITDSDNNVTTVEDTYTINITSVPAHDKVLTPNPAYDDDGNVITETVCDENGENCVEKVKGDGTYQLSLTVTGEADLDEDKNGRVNVLVILDTSSSMVKRWAIDNTNGIVGNTNARAQSPDVLDYDIAGDNTNQNNQYFYLWVRDENNQFVKLVDYLKTHDNYTGTLYKRNTANESQNATDYSTYTGTRFISARADKAEKVLYDFVDELFENQSPTHPDNIQVALVGFSYDHNPAANGYSNQTKIIQNWTSDKTDILGTEDNPKLSSTGEVGSHKINIYQTGTNYEAGFRTGLTALNGLASDDTDPTYVIFITDGQPSQSNTTFTYNNNTYTNGNSTIYSGSDGERVLWYRHALDEALSISNKATLYGIYAFGDEDDYLDDLIYYIYNNQEDRTLSHDADWNKATHDEGTTVDGVKYFYRANDAKELDDAIGTIFNDIVSTIGVSQTQILDGTTSSVQAQSGSLASEGLLDVDDQSFEYWLSWKVNDDNTFKMFNIDNEYNYTLTVNSNGTITFHRDGVSDATYEGTLSNGVVRIKWGDYSSRPSTTFYTSAPQAKFENNVVNWDLKDLHTLLDGVTYEVTFDVWPSQTTLDLQADLKNGIITYEELTTNYPGVADYLDENGNLRTNTFATLKYDDTRTSEDESQNPISYPNPEPVETTTIDEMVISKEWIGYGEIPNISLTIERDGETYKVISLPVTKTVDGKETQSWEETIYISVGILTVKPERDANNNLTYTVTAKTTGHDYSFEEVIGDTTLAYQWELRAPVIHPMMINNVLTMLILEGSDEDNPLTHPSAMTGDYYVDTTNNTKWYKIGGKYYYEDSKVASLNASNLRRSNLNIMKEKDKTSDENAPDDLFEFTIDLDYNPNVEIPEGGTRPQSGEKIWFSIYDTNNGVYIINEGENIYVHTGTLEEKNPATGVTISYDAATGILTYYTDPEEQNKVLVGTSYNYTEGSPYYTGYYYINSDYIEDLIISLKAGWNLRFTNIPTGSTYSITESDSANYKLTGVSSTAVLLSGVSADEMEPGTPGTTSEDGKTVTGTIDAPVTKYTSTFTNKYEETEVDVTKVWDDADDRDNIRPTSVQIKLLADGEVQDTQTLDSSNSWKYTWESLPVYNNGIVIVYTVDEVTTDVITGEDTATTYAIAISGTVASGFKVTNTHTPRLTEASVEKVWDDSNNAANKRPTSITVTLSNGTETVQTVTLNADNEWKARVTGLPILPEGSTYTWTENEADLPIGYYLSNTSVNGTVTTLTNSYDVTGVSVKKVWVDSDDKDGFRPTSVQVQLLADGKVQDTQTLNEDNSWKYTWSDLLKYSDGVLIVYTVDEVTTDVITTTDTETTYGYEVSGTVADGFTVTNTHTPVPTSVSVKKVWVDSDDKDGFRPTSVQVQLLADGKVQDTQTLNEDNSWKYTWEDLLKYSDGVLIVYTVDEVTTDVITTTDTETTYGYEVSGNVTDGFTVTNTHTPVPTSVSVKKVWVDSDDKDGFRPTSVQVQLLADGKVQDTQTLNEDNSWKYTWSDLLKYSDGVLIVYTVDEVTTDVITTTDTETTYGYEVSGTVADGFTVTNTHTPVPTSVSVKKIWVDQDNQDGIRPTELVVTLSNGTQVTLNEENNWTATIEDLPKYADGKEIEYTWTEATIDGYELTDTSVDGTVTTLTNTHEPETISINIIKVWADDDNESGKRPNSVTITLLADDVDYDSVTLTEDVEWKHTFENLPKYSDGKEIIYTVVEKDVPEDYVVAYEGDMTTGFTIHNTLGQGGDVPPENPQTGDNILLYLVTLLISIIGIVSGKMYVKKFN